MSYKAYLDSNHIVAWDAGGADKTVCTIAERCGNVLRIVDIIEFDPEKTVLDPDLLIRFKLTELRIREKARKIRDEVVAEIREKFRCLVDGHDFFQMDDEEGDLSSPWAARPVSYLLCKNCGATEEVDSNDRLDDDWDRTPI